MGTILFLVGNRRLDASLINYVLDDFFMDAKDNGRLFTFEELEELMKMRDSKYFCSSYMYKEVVRYCLPFI